MAFPITLHTNGRRALVAGGGSVALRKVTSLLAGGAHICVVAPRIDPELRTLLESHGGEIADRPYRSGDIEGAFLAVAATGDDVANALVVADARARGILVCDATHPARGDFSMQAVVRVGELTFAIDTGGASPAFAKRLARELRERFGEGYGTAAKTLARMRTYVKAVLAPGERGEVLRALAELPIERLATMNPAQAEHEVEETIEHLRGHVHAPAPGTAVCASRASALAMTQARTVAARLARHGMATTILNVTTTGDRVQDRSLASIGAESLFVKELELALRDGRADYAVHSCKDLPSVLPDDMAIAAVSAREDPRDVFCSERFTDFWTLPAGARVGTSSQRRRAQLAALRDDLAYADIRGNIDTRLRKLRDGDYDAIVLAAAGLNRMRLAAAYSVPFSIEQVVPAVAQGALAVETRAGDSALAQTLREAINDETAELAVCCERAALRRLRGGCQAPIGIHARFDGARLLACGIVATLDGTRIVRAERAAPVASVEQAERLGTALAEELENAGAAEILAAAPQLPLLPLAGRLVILPRTLDRPSRIAAALRAEGADVFELHAGEDGDAGLGTRVPDILVFASSGSVAAAADYLRRLHASQLRPTVAAMGPESSAAALAAGFAPDLVAPEAAIEALLRVVRGHLLESNNS